MERLQKVIAAAGITSRRKAEELITKGKVKVNGKTITELGTKVNEEDIIVVNGVQLSNDKKVYILMNKPRNTVCSVSDDRGRMTVIDLLESVKERVYPVGRLDYDTTGVLLITNDGELSNRLLHPSHEKEKTYRATIKGKVTQEKLETIANGVLIDGIKTSPAVLEVTKVNDEKGKTIVNITIHEGKNHQVKRMFESVGLEVVKLHRINFAGMKLGPLKEGQWRFLTNKEIQELKGM